MKKAKPNLRKMFNFHTIILVILVLVVSTLHTHTSEGKLQRLHKHHRHHSYKNHNVVVVGESNDDGDDDGDKQQQSHAKNHRHLHPHERNLHHHHHHHHQRQQQQQHSSQHYQRSYDATTPSLEFTTSSSASSAVTATITGDNEFLIKQHTSTQPLHHKDEIYYPSSATAATANSSSTTSKPPISIRLMKQNVHNLKTSIQAETIRERSHHSPSGRLVSTPFTNPEGNNGLASNNRTNNFATMYHVEGFQHKNSNWNLTTKDVDARPQSEQSVQQLHQNHKVEKPELHHEQQRPQQNYEDYYSDAEEDDLDDDGDNDYSEDEGDNDGLSYDDDNNLSDRSYARITRSKLDDDYIDDEPYRNGINDLSMQRDAAPGVLTEQKYLEVGNEKAVQQARERYIQEQKRPRTPHELATEHWHRMIQATKCRKPLPRVIPVSNNTSKRYEPYATILHRCGDDTGCCGSTASVCTVKRHEIVMVYVFSYDFNYRKEIEALPMQNHTECHCVNRGSLLHDSMPRDKRSGGSSSYSHHLQRQQRKQQQQYESDSQSYSQLQYHHQQSLQNTLDCHCPRHFNVFEEDVERRVHLPQPHSVFIRKCRCDCLVNNQTCLRFKHGEEGFSLEDRKCILEHNCKPPYCSYGEYNSRVGRCPSYRSHLLQTT